MAKVPEELGGFVEDALRRGVERPEIARVLREAGWPGERVDAALAGWAETEFPIPVPRPRVQPSAKEAFFYLLLFTTLAIAAFNLGSLCFALIDGAFPDALERGAFSEQSRASQIRWAISALVIATPIYAYVSRMVNRRVARDPVRRRSPVRRWLTYIALFIAAGVLIGDLIALVNGFLAGELTARFGLKSLTVAVIAGTVFGYYLWDLRGDDEAP